MFTRTLCTQTERYAKGMFGVNARKAASVTCSRLAGRKSYTVEILGVHGVERFVWIDRASDAYEARHLAWRSFMKKHAPGAVKQDLDEDFRQLNRDVVKAGETILDALR